MPTIENRKLIEACYHDFNRRCIDRILERLYDSVEYNFVPANWSFRGRDQVERALKEWSSRFPNLQIEIERIVATEDGGASEIVVYGTYARPLTPLLGGLGVTRTRVELSGCDLFSIRDGKLVSIHSYFDSADLSRQLGVVPRERAA